MKRYEVWLARLDPAEGSEMRKTRPVVVLSPDVMNQRLHTVLVAPLTRGGFRPMGRVESVSVHEGRENHPRGEFQGEFVFVLDGGLKRGR